MAKEIEDPGKDRQPEEAEEFDPLETEEKKEPGILMPGTYFRRWLTIRDQPSALERVAMGVLCIVVVLCVWHLLTMGETGERIIGAYTLPSISETASSFESLWVDRALARSAAWSLGRVLGGFLLAAAVAIPVGVLAGCYLRLHAFLKPLSIFGRNIPIAALIPLTLIWFGLGESQKIMFIFLTSIAFIFFDTVHSIDGVSNRFLDTAYTLGARRDRRRGLMRALWTGLIYGAIFMLVVYLVSEDASLGSGRFWATGLAGAITGFVVWLPIQSHQVIYKVMLPLALPNIVNSLRLLFGLAFGYIMLAEVINAKHGLGNIIIMSQRRGPREHIYLSLIIIAVLAFAIDRLVLWAQHRWFPYKEHK